MKFNGEVPVRKGWYGLEDRLHNWLDKRRQRRLNKIAKMTPPPAPANYKPIVPSGMQTLEQKALDALHRKF